MQKGFLLKGCQKKYQHLHLKSHKILFHKHPAFTSGAEGKILIDAIDKAAKDFKADMNLKKNYKEPTLLKKVFQHLFRY